MTDNNDPITVVESTRVQEAARVGLPVIDVRPTSMYEAGHVPGAVNVPLIDPEDGSMVPDDQLVAAVETAGVQPTDDVVLYCQTGLHAGLAADTLAQKGFSNVELYSGSMNDWSAKGLPIEH